MEQAEVTEADNFIEFYTAEPSQEHLNDDEVARIHEKFSHDNNLSECLTSLLGLQEGNLVSENTSTDNLTQVTRIGSKRGEPT